ncbi:hypothetical protein WR25_11875 [Diploscapter pachys]|uniref:Uncharacterized protein n=1 Tax=Diploscapter pachys TaxID=2018661 RepID=A0A2A2LPA4_9BILA|nr:hypothetical protein WR25_11875 [Diploscapter pachys]
MFFYHGFWYTYTVQLGVMSVNRHQYLDFAVGIVPCPIIVFSYSFIFIKLRRNNKNMAITKRNASVRRDPENQTRNKVNATELRLLIQISPIILFIFNKNVRTKVNAMFCFKHSKEQAQSINKGTSVNEAHTSAMTAVY